MGKGDLACLKAELAAIQLWDDAYLQSRTHNESDSVAYLTRQKRRREIMREIEDIAVRLGACACPGVRN